MAGLELRYFVLKPKGSDDFAWASRMAMRTFAEYIKMSQPELAEDLITWADTEEMEAYPNLSQRIVPNAD